MTCHLVRTYEQTQWASVLVVAITIPMLPNEQNSHHYQEGIKPIAHVRGSSSPPGPCVRPGHLILLTS